MDNSHISDNSNLTIKIENSNNTKGKNYFLKFKIKNQELSRIIITTKNTINKKKITLLNITKII